MKIKHKTKVSADGRYLYHSFEWGRKSGERVVARNEKGETIFTYSKPSNEHEKFFNKQVEAVLTKKLAELQTENVMSGSGLMPKHLSNPNFLPYFQIYIDENPGKIHAGFCLEAFKKWLAIEKKRSEVDFISFNEMTERLCTRFRDHLLKIYNGKTPAEYFSPFKDVLKCATKDGYFRINPAEDVKAKKHPSKQKPVTDTPEELLEFFNAPCPDPEVKRAAIFAYYAGGLYASDLRKLTWEKNIIGNRLVTERAKNRQPINNILGPEALKALGPRGTGPVFKIPYNTQLFRVMKEWRKNAGTSLNITFGCIRHNTSVHIQDAGATTQTAMTMLGHTSLNMVNSVYRRARPKLADEALLKLNNKTTAQNPTNENAQGKELKLIETYKSLGMSNDQIIARLSQLAD